MEVNMYRTHTCGELRTADVDKKVKLAGWIQTTRDMGGIVFIDLRDQYGITQLVSPDDQEMVNKLSRIPTESTISVTGLVKLRDEETINKNIATGEVEVKIESVEILGKRTKSLPFEVNTNQEVREDLRLQYRFLDIRNDRVKNNILLRAQVIQFLREQMIAKNFTEVQTPILTSSSPALYFGKNLSS